MEPRPIKWNDVHFSGSMSISQIEHKMRDSQVPVSRGSMSRAARSWFISLLQSIYA